MKTHTLRRAISIALFAVTSGATGLAAAQDEADRRETALVSDEVQDAQQFDLLPGALGASLDAVGAQSGLRIAYPTDLVAKRQGRAVHGRMHWREAIAMLLQDSGLAYREADDGTVVIEPAHAEPGRGVASAPADARASRGANATDLETITVTGTRIRGGTTPSPVITIGAESIRTEGFSDLGNVIRSIPQNFSGGQNPEVGSGGLSGAGAANRNVTGGSGLNLRGLGPDATLTLLNGRRLSYGGMAQSVDISAIPVEAIDRIEIVADGASAIYGSDAVGGVGNVILRRDFDGVSVGARYGGATSGGLATREYVATAGGHWERGGWIGTLKRSPVDPIHASQRSYTDHLVPPTTIYPGSTLRSGLLSGHQRLGERAELRLDALRTERDQVYYYEYFGTNWIQSETTTSIVSPGIEIALPGDWTLTLGGTWARDEYQDHQTSTDAATGISDVVSDSCFCNESHSYEAGLEGSWFSLGGGDVRVALGAGYRSNGLRAVNRLTGANTVEGEESARFAYAEMAVPLVGPGQRVANIHRLDLTAALRGEDYRTTGSVVTPKLGVVYGPSPDVTFKASWGRAFKAPTLNERYSDSVAYLHVPGIFGGSGYDDTAAVLYTAGGNPDLAPERARTWSTTLAFHPEHWPGLDAEVAFFDIDYRDRVVEPIASITQAMSNPNYAQLIEYDPGADEQARILAGIDQVFNFTGASYEPGNVVALINARRANVARQRIRGVDLSGAYRFEVARGSLTVRGSGSWLDSKQQNLAGQGTYDLSGTLFNPARRRARMGVTWRQGGLAASSFANYTAGVEDVTNAQRTASFTTFDATVRYAFNGGRSAWSDVDVALSAHNVLNRAPPLHVPALVTYAAPYDGTNYSAVGRFLSLSISKHF
ncbi:TonB-dependent receptor [Luteimonas sp. XNQY3]|nr:TonB-dependent receptor [Luteimonas sp. XNQY3]MCD9007023.1 TonB-dependent receptor [Luteimonas sp. XNQY3]